MIALSITFAGPAAMNPPLSVASSIGWRQRAPISAKSGNQASQAWRSLRTDFWPVKKVNVYWRSMGGTRSGSTALG